MELGHTEKKRDWTIVEGDVTVMTPSVDRTVLRPLHSIESKGKVIC